MNAWTRRDFLRITGLSAAAMAAPGWTGAAEAARKPNIIFILADDWGWSDTGCYGSDAFKNMTPNIDAMAKSGLRFEMCFSSPLCAPSRCLINTGRYAFRTGGLGNGSWLPGGAGAKAADEFPIAKMLKKAGYATCSTGKWRQIEETPGDWGFDEWATDQTYSGWYWRKFYVHNGEQVTSDTEMYCPDEYHKIALDFIQRHKDSPFYLYYPSHLIHGKITKTPDSKPDSKDFYADSIAYLDKEVGEIVAEVERLGIAENTLILFAGDNGTETKRTGTVGGRQINGRKGQMLEGAVRVPLVAKWKGTMPEGKVCKDLVDFSDFYATFAELAGADMPSGFTFDSRSFAPQLRGEPGTPREWVYVQRNQRFYVREKNWKLDESGTLYDMTDAPFVEKEVASDSENAEAAAARKRLQAVLDQLNPKGGKTEPPDLEANERKRKKDRAAKEADKASGKTEGETESDEK